MSHPDSSTALQSGNAILLMSVFKIKQLMYVLRIFIIKHTFGSVLKPLIKHEVLIIIIYLVNGVFPFETGFQETPGRTTIKS